MVAADLVRVLLATILAVWHDDVAIAYAVAFGLSAGQVFFSPAVQSLLPAVVEDEELMAANSGIWTAAVTAQILVAPAAALLAVQVSFGAAFAVNATSFALSAVVLRGLREPERPQAASVSSPFAHLRETLEALAALPLLKALAAGHFLAALLRLGRLVDPAWANRMLLLRGYDTLSARAKARLDWVFATNDLTHELAAAWGVKEQLRRLLHSNTVEQARHEKMTMGCYVLAGDMAETWRLWNTLQAWWPAVEVLITTGVSNARTEPANTGIKQIKRTGRGYTNSGHYQARILLTSAARHAT